MTTRDDLDPATPDFDRLMRDWFDAEARVHEPDDLLDRTISRTAHAHPRPAWLLPERWIPMELTMRRTPLLGLARYAALAVVLILLAALAIAFVGSQRRVPAPFGLAANGAVVYATAAGDIATVDPATGVTTTVVGGPEVDRYPVFSLDGTRIAFVRRVAGGDEVIVVDATGGGPVRLTKAPLPSPGLLTWSPDGSRLAFDSAGSLWIASTDGSDAHMVDLGMALDAEIEWRPPSGAELIVRGTHDGMAGLFLVKADGTDPRAITPVDGGTNDYLWVTWSPDGSRVAYHKHPALEVHMLTIGQEHPLVLRPVDVPGMMFPRFSPDGTKLAVMVWDGVSGSATRIGILPADGPTPRVILTGPTFHSGIQFDWSPDGTRILAAEWGSDQPWSLDPAGGPGTKTTWLATFPDWVEWQRLAR